MTTLPPVPPWAELIATRRKALIPPVSMRQAAMAAEVSASTWSSIEKSRKKVAPDVETYVRGEPDKIAMMARFLEITPDELRGANRADAASYLERLIQGSTNLSERQKRLLGREVRRDIGDP